MDFESAFKRYRRLAERYNQGQLTSEQFERAVEQLAVTDEEGNLWQIGIRSGKWYRFEDEHWHEDIPPSSRPPESQLTPESKQKQSLFRIIGTLLLIGLLLACLAGAVYLTADNWDKIGDALGRSNIAEDQEAGIEETEQQTDSEEETPTVEQSSEEPTQSPTQTPSPQPTATQPEPTKGPQVEPQVWSLISGNDFTNAQNLTGAWATVPQRDWEWEFLDYAGETALYLQFSGEQEFILDQSSPPAWDIESGALELDLALPEQDAQVFLICRLQQDSGDHYAFKVTNSGWAILAVTGGEEAVLAQGKTSETFSRRNLERFRFECSGSTLTAYDQKRQLAEITGQDGLEKGALAVRLSAGTGVGRIYLASEYAMMLTEEAVGSLFDVIRLETLSVSFTESWRVHQPMVESDYEGDALVSLELLFENIGGQSLEIKAEDIYLQQNGKQIYALDFVPESAIDPNPLELPVSIRPGSTVSGEVYFSNLSEADLSTGWGLSIDLTDLGSWVIQFQIPGE
jgi:hypothetical protein